MDNDFATGYALGADSNNNCNNGNGNGFGWGGDWIWAFLIFALFGWGNGGWGGGFGGGNGVQGALTRADLCQDMNFQGVENGIRGIQQGLCDGFYAMNTGMLNGFNGVNTTLMQGFHGVDNAVCTLGYQTQAGFNALSNQLASCCCETQRAIDGVNYNMATNTCALQTAMANNTRDIIDSQNAGTRAILDYLCNQEMQNLRSENQGLRLAASQAAQNNVIGARIDAATAEILRKTGAECPTAAYLVQPPQPVSFATNCAGQAVFNNGWGNCGNGCGSCC